MPQSVPKVSSSTLVNSLDGVRPVMAKATVGRTAIAVVKETLIRHYGSLKAAALTLGMDQGQLSRELESGDFKFKRLDHDPDAAAIVATALHAALGAHLHDPKARVRQIVRELRAKLDEVEQYLEFCA